MKTLSNKFYLLLFIFILGIGLGWFGSILRFGLPVFTLGQPKDETNYLEELHLSQTQLNTIEEIKKRHNANLIIGERRLQEAHRNFDTIVQTSTDSKQIQTAYEEVTNVRREMDRIRFYQFIDVANSLTPEQRRILKLPHPAPKK